MRKTIMLLLIIGILCTGTLPILQDVCELKGNRFSGDFFDPVDEGSSTNGEGGSGGHPAPG